MPGLRLEGGDPRLEPFRLGVEPPPDLTHEGQLVLEGLDVGIRSSAHLALGASLYPPGFVHDVRL